MMRHRKCCQLVAAVARYPCHRQRRMLGPRATAVSPYTRWGSSALWAHLVRQLAGMAEHDGANLRGGGGLNLLQHAEHKHSRLSHAGLGLAQHVHAQYSLRDALVLHCEQQTRRHPSVNTTRTRLRMQNAKVCYSHVVPLLICHVGIMISSGSAFNQRSKDKTYNVSRCVEALTKCQRAMQDARHRDVELRPLHGFCLVRAMASTDMPSKRKVDDRTFMRSSRSWHMQQAFTARTVCR